MGIPLPSARPSVFSSQVLEEAVEFVPVYITAVGQLPMGHSKLGSRLMLWGGCALAVLGLAILGGTAQLQKRIATVALTLMNLPKAQTRLDRSGPRQPRDYVIFMKYQDTTLRLCRAAMLHAQAEKKTRQWPATPKALGVYGLTPNQQLDSWRQRILLRGPKVLSIGMDGEVDTSDDIWIDASTLRLDGFRPKVQQPPIPPFPQNPTPGSVQRWMNESQKILSAESAAPPPNAKP